MVESQDKFYSSLSFRDFDNLMKFGGSTNEYEFTAGTFLFRCIC